MSELMPPRPEPEATPPAGRRGRYVALEGVEGAGKTTIRAGLAERLRADALDVLEIREPGATEIGERIRRMLLDPGGRIVPWTEAMLFAAARAQLAAEVIAPALAAGTWVVADRSVYSSLAYQGEGRGLGVEQVRVVNASGLGGVWPDAVVLLRIDAQQGLARQEVLDRIGAEGLGFQRLVAKGFDKLAAAEPDRFIVVDATDPVDDVVGSVHRELKARWP
jgi:dTMP kinase